jgi:hypothetical protein
MKALFSLLLKLKQHFRENKEFQNAFSNSDQIATYYTDFYYKLALSYNSIEKLVTDPDKKDEKKSLFLVNQVFRKTYIGEKKLLDDWLRVIRVLDITTNELKKQKAIKAFSKASIRSLKNPGVVFEQSVNKPSNPEEDPHGLRTHGKPMFEIDNTHNIMVV